jgi:hypothetical protein
MAEKTAVDKPKVDRRAQGRKGADVTRQRNFRHPTGEAVSVDKYIRLTSHEDDQIKRVGQELGMSDAGVVRMAIYLFVEDHDKMWELAERYRAEVG